MRLGAKRDDMLYTYLVGLLLQKERPIVQRKEPVNRAETGGQ